MRKVGGEGGGAGVCDDAHIGLSIKRNFGLDKVSFLFIFCPCQNVLSAACKDGRRNLL